MGTGGNQPGIDPGRAGESLTAFMRMVYAASNASASSSNPVPLTASPSSPVPPLSSQPPASKDKPLSQEEPRVSTIQLRAIEPDSDDEGASVDSSVGLRLLRWWIVGLLMPFVLR